MKESRPNLSSRLAGITHDLDSLEQELKCGEEPDREILDQFRRSVDEIRNTAWTIGELMNARAIGKERVVLSFLAAERMRRFSQMVVALAQDIDDRAVTWETRGVQKVSESLEILQARLQQLLEEHRSRMKTVRDAGD